LVTGYFRFDDAGMNAGTAGWKPAPLGNGVEMSLDAALVGACATKAATRAWAV
jgi:hypothetical protein